MAMEKNTTSKIVKSRSLKLESSKQSKIVKRFYSQFLEMLTRKTDSDRRIELYGKDPFK